MSIAQEARESAMRRLDDERDKRCIEIADQVVPVYRDPKARHSGCGSHTAKRWQAAWDAACIALGGDPAEYRR